MNMTELSIRYPLLEDTKKAVDKVEELTGKPMVFHLVDDMMSHAKLKAARSFMPAHIVYINRKYVAYINHLIIHECHHVFRFWSVDNDRRWVMASNAHSDEVKKRQWQREMGKRAAHMPSAVWDMWLNGYMTLLYNCITDTRIERAIFVDYPGVRGEQANSLKGLEDEIKRSLDKSVEMMAPPSLFVETSAMNYAFLKEIEPIVGRSWRKAFKGRNDILTLGGKLHRMIPKVDEGLSQDIAVLNKWSSVLHADIEWAPFERVPLSYPTDY